MNALNRKNVLYGPAETGKSCGGVTCEKAGANPEEADALPCAWLVPSCSKSDLRRQYSARPGRRRVTSSPSRTSAAHYSSICMCNIIVR